MRWRSVVAVLALLASATACTDDGPGGSPSGALSVLQFCAALGTFQSAVDAVDPAEDLAGYITALEAAATELADGGVPAEMPDDASDGFAITIERIEALSATATLDELSQLGDVPDADQRKLDALDDYITSACPELGGPTGGESATP